jgi:TldD protein
VPVSAVAPAMLLSTIETQRQPQGTTRPPILAIPSENQGSVAPAGGAH